VQEPTTLPARSPLAIRLQRTPRGIARTRPRSSARSSGTVRTPTLRLSGQDIRRPRCTGRRAMTTSSSSTHCSMPAPTSNVQALRSTAALPCSPPPGTGRCKPFADSWSGAPSTSSGTPWSDETPLDMARAKGHDEVAAWLLDNGAGPGASTPPGMRQCASDDGL